LVPLSMPNSSSKLNSNELELPSPHEGARSTHSIGDSSETRAGRARGIVRWGTVQVNSHRIILGDNAACSCGPPVTIDWDSFETVTLDLDSYEAHKDPTASRRKGQLLLPRQVREDMLRHAGYARSSVRDATEAAAWAQKQRTRSSRDGRLREALTAAARRVTAGRSGADVIRTMTRPLQEGRKAGLGVVASSSRATVCSAPE
jgi:hypothetical protein